MTCETTHSAGRRQLRTAFRWMQANPHRAFPPPSVETAVRALLAAATAEIVERDARGLPRPRRITFLGAAFAVRCTQWGRIVLTDDLSGVAVTSRYGAI